jgi:L-fuconolactonase
MRIDAHQHYWRIDAPGHEWPTPDLTSLYRDFLPGDLDPVCAMTGVDATIAVQSQPCDADTDWLVRLAADTPSIAGVVGWANLKAPAAPQRIAHLAQQPKLRGLRPMLQALPVDWILDPAVAPAIAAMIEHDLVFDALIRPDHLPAITAFAAAHPKLTIVIDHGAKPDIAAGERDAWRAGMAQVARLQNVNCKISGLLTEASEEWRAGDVTPYIADLLQLFGPRRLLWGSDWPVVLLRSDYGTWHDLVVSTVLRLSSGERAAIFGGTAARLYRLFL